MAEKEKADKGGKPDKPQKPDKQQKPQKAGKAEKADQAEPKAAKAPKLEKAAEPPEPRVPPRLRTLYDDVVRKKLTEQFSYQNPMQVPALDKIVINMGIGEGAADR
jgi:large subunit ribosomal protein L5